jgi:hypothetical protein
MQGPTASAGGALGQDHRRCCDEGPDGSPVLKLPNATFRFAKGPVDLMTGCHFASPMSEGSRAAKAKGCKVAEFIRSLRRDLQARRIKAVVLRKWNR